MKTVDFQGIRIRIDRPKGFAQQGKDKTGKLWRRVYSYDYGFLPRTQGGDGDSIDVFLGPSANARDTYWVSQRKDDGTFDEYKVFLGFASKEAAKRAYGAHIPMRHFGSIVAIPLEMVKAMLGIEPRQKVAMWVGFFGELNELDANWSGL